MFHFFGGAPKPAPAAAQPAAPAKDDQGAAAAKPALAAEDVQARVVAAGQRGAPPRANAIGVGVAGLASAPGRLQLAEPRPLKVPEQDKDLRASPWRDPAILGLHCGVGDPDALCKDWRDKYPSRGEEIGRGLIAGLEPLVARRSELEGRLRDGERVFAGEATQELPLRLHSPMPRAERYLSLDGHVRSALEAVTELRDIQDLILDYAELQAPHVSCLPAFTFVYLDGEVLGLLIGMVGEKATVLFPQGAPSDPAGVEGVKSYAHGMRGGVVKGEFALAPFQVGFDQRSQFKPSLYFTQREFEAWRKQVRIPQSHTLQYARVNAEYQLRAREITQGIKESVAPWRKGGSLVITPAQRD